MVPRLPHAPSLVRFPVHIDLFCYPMAAGLGSSHERIAGPTYATSAMDIPRPAVEPFDEYVRSRLAAEMCRHRGRRRIRKKKAVAALRVRWRIAMFARPIDYTAVGRRLFPVDPLPQGALPIYIWDPDVTGIVTGSHGGDE